MLTLRLLYLSFSVVVVNITGQPSEIDVLDFELRASLFFTLLSKIEQANGDKQLTRAELASTLGDLVNTY